MNVDRPILNAIGLCSGVGMLDEGVAAGLGYMGIDVRHVLYAEREAYPVAVLEARMEEGSLCPAPVWFGDFTKLPAAEFRGLVDIIIAGFPCQDLSVAGRRDGLDGKRSGLFFNILDIADACGAWCLALENVAGIASATASVVDEAEGELDERAAARVVGELADRGWNAEWLTLSASDVGASHGRARWFAFAWRTDRMGNAGLQHSDVQQRGSGAEHPGAGQPVADTDHGDRPGHAVGTLAQEGAQWNDEGRADAELRRPFFAPGPADPRWPGILQQWPHVAPALVADFRVLVDGLAFGMDDCRAQRLKCVGNGVVALQASLAIVQLARRAGLRP